MAKTKNKKHTLYLRDGDFDFIRDIYEPKGVPASHVIKAIVSKFVDNIRATAQPLPKNLEDIE